MFVDTVDTEEEEEAVEENHFYPFDGLRTMKDAKEFCDQQYAYGATFGTDDNNILTQGKIIANRMGSLN